MPSADEPAKRTSCGSPVRILAGWPEASPRLGPKDADQERKTILARLDGATDERAGTVKEALGKKDWGLAAAEAILGDHRAAVVASRRLGRKAH